MGDHSIQLTPARQADGSIQWTMDYDGNKGSSPGTYPVITLKAKEDHDLTYTIDNPEGLSINFDPSMVQTSSGSIHNALWVQANTKPTQAVLSDQIDDVDVKPTKLKFDDENTGSPMTLIYQINFVDAANPGAKVTPLDPELKNGGGNGMFFQDYAVVIAVVGAILIAALLFRRFRRTAARQNPTA